jgi:hypothetical protein
MLLDLNSRLDVRKIREAKLHSSVTTIDEGAVMVGVLENGVSVANIWATGTATFLGFAQTRLKYPSTVIEVEELTVAAGAVTLKAVPTAVTQVVIRNLTDNAAMSRVVALSTTPAAVITEFTIAAASRAVGVNVTENGDRLRITYRRAITVMEAISRNGHGVNISPLEANEITNTVSLIRGGEIFIDNIDATSNWHATTAAYVGTGGVITATSTSSILIPDFRVTALPTPDVPFLGFEFGSI